MIITHNITMILVLAVLESHDLNKFTILIIYLHNSKSFQKWGLFTTLPITSAIIAIIVTIVVLIFVAQSYDDIINSLVVHSKQPSAKALPSSSTPSLNLIQTIVIPNVNGRIDHMAIDIRGQRLFVAELGNNSLDIIDLNASKRVHSISNNDRLLNEPQSVVYIPELNRIFVSNGQDGSVDVFDAKSFSFIKKINLPSLKTKIMTWMRKLNVK